MTDLSSGELTIYDVIEPLKPVVECIATGDDTELEKQLISKSFQPHIIEHTPNDSLKRFGNADMLREWKTRGRNLHWLLGPGKDLAGIIWYGLSKFPIDVDLPEIPNETFAIRLYENYVGKGLAKPFMKQSLQIAVQQKQAQNIPVNGIWLQTDLDNEAAVASYLKFGYIEVHRDEERVTMVLTAKQVLLTANA